MITSFACIFPTTAPWARLLRAGQMLTIGLLLLALGCQGDSGERRRALEEAPAKHLVGVWDATFWLDRPISLGAAARNPPRSITGLMALVEDHQDQVSSEDLSDPTHVGVYDIDFSSFGFQPGDTHSIPVAVARTTARRTVGPGQTAPGSERDSVTIVLDPGTSRYPCRLTGAFSADSITGVWTAGQALGGGGRFLLTRRRTRQ